MPEPLQKQVFRPTRLIFQSSFLSEHLILSKLTLKVPNFTIAVFANNADPDETAHNVPSYLDLQYLPSSLGIV